MQERFLLLLVSQVAIAVASSFYTAAVVDFAPYALNSTNVTQQQAVDLMMKNMDKMEIFIKKATVEGVQIIAFPEYCLIGTTPLSSRDSALPFLEQVPNPSGSPYPLNPCVDPSSFPDSPVLIRASCLSRQYGIALVFDMGSIEYCNSSQPNCQSDGRNQYNTQVAFDTNGDLIGRYLKNHLYYEPWYNPPYQPDNSTFVTRFGVEFGMIICFDLLFEVPSQVYKSKGVENVVLSTWWVNMPPLQVAVEAQQGWSLAYGMNLIASGFALEGYRSSGSGIYGNQPSTSPTVCHYESQETVGISTMLYATVENGVVIDSGTWVIPWEETTETAKEPTLIIKDLMSQFEGIVQFSVYEDLNYLSSLDGVEFPTTVSPFWFTEFEANPGATKNLTMQVHDFNCSFSYTVSENSNSSNRYVVAAINVHEIPGIVPAPVIGCFILKCDPILCQFGEEKGEVNPGSVFSDIQISASFPEGYAVFPWISGPQGQLPTTSEVTYNFASAENNLVNYVSATHIDLEIMSYALLMIPD